MTSPVQWAHYKALTKDVLVVVVQHKLTSEVLGITVKISAQDFDVIAANYPDQPPGIILISAETEGIQWFVQIMPESR